ncbi:ATP phosphoribosyltransferase [Klebsiella pneumoniae]|uniref:ATP phosphoribosyltransferase n=1 Tax=Klebsiella pneumoniae TaxID=573 RepID=A0A2X3EZV5_KLEPN|nr:ATP phosphoribosyltransferase [Klebsiella pneumoniae]
MRPEKLNLLGFTLAELDSVCMDGTEQLIKLLHERSGSSTSKVRNDLSKTIDEDLIERLLITCQGDIKLRDRIKPYVHLLRTDPWGYPLVYPAGAFMVIGSSNRRETGTHYTPKSLTEAIVAETLTPLTYFGPVEGSACKEWTLKTPAELLDLKICDPAMGVWSLFSTGLSLVSRSSRRGLGSSRNQGKDYKCRWKRS